MKKTLLIIISIFLISFLTACYDDNNTATVKINLGNLPIAKQVENKSFIDKILCFFSKEAVAQSMPETIRKIHLAAYNGNSLIATKSISSDDLNPTDTVVEFKVPANKNITILVVGETLEYDINDNLVSIAGYYGYKKTDLEAGVTTDIQIIINYAIWDSSATYGLRYDLSCADYILYWTHSGVPTKYIIRNSDTKEVLWQGYGTTAPDTIEWGELVVEFEAFKLQTIPAEPNGC